MGSFSRNFGDILHSASIIATTMDKDFQEQARLSTQTKELQLQTDINAALTNIRNSSNDEEWNTQINDLFTRVQSGMSNKNSPYYCRNNLQAQQFTAILEQHRLGATTKVQQMVEQRQNEKQLLDIQNAETQAFNMYGPNEFINKANELWAGAYRSGLVSPTQLAQQKERVFKKAYTGFYIRTAEENIQDAINRGMSADEYWNEIYRVKPEMKLTDINGLEIDFDKSTLDDLCKKQVFDMYNSKQRDAWQQTEKEFAVLWDNIKDQKSVESKNMLIKQGRAKLDQLKNTGRMSSDQIIKWTNWLTLEDYIDGGTTTSAQATSAAGKMSPKDLMAWTINAMKRGDESELGGVKSVYDAWDFYKNRVIDEYTSIPENENATWAEIEKQYPVVGTFFEEAEKNLPEQFQDVVEKAKNVMKQILNTKEDEELYKEEYSEVMEYIKDLIFDQNISNLDSVTIDALKKRIVAGINSRLGGVLEKKKEYKWLKDMPEFKTLSKYREGFNQEKTMARAMLERDSNPDLVYSDKNGNDRRFYNPELDQGLLRLENDERKELVKIIKDRTGKTVDVGELSSNYEPDELHDVSARKVYHYDNMDYRFRSEDGKHIILEQKKSGTDKWEVSKTQKQQKKYDKPEEVAKRAVSEKDISTIPDGGFTYTDANGTERQLMYNLPVATKDSPREKAPITQEYWDSINTVVKKQIIAEFIKLNPEAAQEWLDSLTKK